MLQQIQKQRVSLLDAAVEIGCAPQALREHMKKGCGIWARWYLRIREARTTGIMCSGES